MEKHKKIIVASIITLILLLAAFSSGYVYRYILSKQKKNVPSFDNTAKNENKVEEKKLSDYLEKTITPFPEEAKKNLGKNESENVSENLISAEEMGKFLSSPKSN